MKFQLKLPFFFGNTFSRQKTEEDCGKTETTRKNIYVSSYIVIAYNIYHPLKFLFLTWSSQYLLCYLFQFYSIINNIYCITLAFVQIHIRQFTKYVNRNKCFSQGWTQVRVQGSRPPLAHFFFPNYIHHFGSPKPQASIQLATIQPKNLTKIIKTFTIVIVLYIYI